MSGSMSETFIGGFAGGFLEKGLHVGYGLYFTTSRVIGVELNRGGGALAGMMAGFIHGELMPRLSPEESTQTIAMLDEIKDMALRREQIRAIDLKRPGLGTGSFTITMASGDVITIKLRHRTAYDRLIQLVQAFGPELVRSS